MAILSPEARAAAETVRLERAIDRFANYELQREPGTDVFRVLGGTHPYETTETHCSCPDHTYRGVACVHIQMVRGRLLAEGSVRQREAAQRAKRAIADRELWS